MAVSGLILRAGVGPEATITTLVLRGLNAAPLAEPNRHNKLWIGISTSFLLQVLPFVRVR